jgi:DNA-binding response OmpR family regulator
MAKKKSTTTKKGAKAAKKQASPAAFASSPVVAKLDKKILIVEDEDAMAKVLVNKFNGSGFDTKRACNGKEAVDVMDQEQFDLVLLDLLMPGKDGFSVLAEITATQNARTPVYVLTNFGEDEVSARTKKLGARECLMKSRTSLNELVEKVKAEVGA